MEVVEHSLSDSPMAPLLDLSHELLHCIATFCDGAELANLAASCKALRDFIRHNRLLHKAVYLSRYDDPRQDCDWEDLLHKSTRLEKILDSSSRDVKRQEQAFVSEQICAMIRGADTQMRQSRNIAFLGDTFKRTDNADVFLCASSMFGLPGAGNGDQHAAETPELQQASAKLHSLYGVPIDVVLTRSAFSIFRPDVMLAPSECTRSRSRPILTHTFARSKVYDLREYTDESLWGPFMSDGSGRIDWEKVEAVMIVLGYNMRKYILRADGRFPPIWDKPFVGAAPGSYRSVPQSPLGEEEMQLDKDIGLSRKRNPEAEALDPYGVTGTWMRVVCFLDYNDLHTFNFAEEWPAGEPREPIDTEEAIRLIRIKLYVHRVVMPGTEEYEDDEDDMDWSGFTGTRMPIVYFRGDSRSLHASWDPNANSRIRGSVRMTPEGEVRWTTFSIFHGLERWRSEGIQVGGVRSGRGVLGNWFDKNYDTHGPAGPTAFWKESDDLLEEGHNGLPLAFFS